MGQNTLQKAFSTIDSQAIEILLGNIMKIIFDKIDTFMTSYESVDAIDWDIYSKFREDEESTNILENNQGLFNFKEKEIKIEEKKELTSILSSIKENTLSKAGGFKKYFESAIVYLRLIEVITTLSLKVENFQEFLMKSVTPQIILNLVKITLMGHPKYSMVAIKILKNLIKIGINEKHFSKALSNLQNPSIPSSGLKIKNSRILELLLSKI